MRAALSLLVLTLGYSDPLQVGDDLIWTADTESGSLEQWMANGAGERLTPTRAGVEFSSEPRSG